MGAQIVEIGGQKMAMLPIADYERLLDLADDKADALAAERAARRRAEGEEYLPADMVDRLLAGESALKVWRNHRGLTLAKLSEVSRVSLTQISDMERRTRYGRPAQWRNLADALNVSVDDILPEA
ncbi:MAG: helix-turn-helix transcriptional regulator [Pseudomonadota bacterium]|nr:helix-turn-helix transcriptional regulator [Pseudomonadota bacterium]